MATYVIGDVQGCWHPLIALLKEIGYSGDKDILWFVGDLVNRGPYSLKVLEFVMGCAEGAITVLGNHDIHLLGAHVGLRKLHPSDTLDDILASPKREKLMEWLRHRPLIHQQDSFFMVHAGLWPSWTADEAKNFASEAEALLQSSQYAQILSQLSGSVQTAWVPTLEGSLRTRTLVNIFTRMRFLTEIAGQLTLDFAHHDHPQNSPPTLRPWFDYPTNYTHTVLCGHWASLGLCFRPQMIMLDSGCVWGKNLTAYRLEDGKIFQVPATF